MQYKERIPKAWFRTDGHFLGRPADAGDRIIARRVSLVMQIPNFPGKKFDLLDIGCGNGASMFLLAGNMKSCSGIDINADHVPEFNARKLATGSANCNCTIADIERTKPEKQFDRIISFEVIEHLTSEKSIRYYYESLKPGGLMVITVPNKWWIFETHGAKLPLLPWNRVPFFSWLPRIIHERFANARIYTAPRICKLLQDHGFEIILRQYVTAPMDVLPEGACKRIIIKYFFNTDTTRIPFKATSILVAVRKPQ